MATEGTDVIHLLPEWPLVKVIYVVVTVTTSTLFTAVARTRLLFTRFLIVTQLIIISPFSRT
jgi:hypothetical protein